MMAQWRIKEMSDLTHISVRMLRYYDKMSLLKPSVRSANGYRWYNEQDLATLQQILALRFFGFDLGQIKTMLQQKLEIRQHLQVQQAMLKEQAAQLTQAHEALETVIARLGPSGVPDWNDLISLIERYRMSEAIKKTWAGKNLNETQLAAWIEIRKQHPQEFELYEKLIEQINEMKFGKPESAQAQEVILQLLDINKKIKDTLAQLRKLNVDIMRSIKAGKISDLALTPEGNLWFQRGLLFYWLGRWESVYQEIKKNLGADPHGAAGKKVAQAWRGLLAEQCVGTSPDLVLGTMLWHDMARQQVQLPAKAAASPAEELMKNIHIDFLLDADAMNWIEVALSSH